MTRVLLYAVAVAVMLGTPSPGSATELPTPCQGRGLAALTHALGEPVDRNLEQVLARPLIALWKLGHPATQAVPDGAHVLLGPKDPLIVALTAGSCVVDAVPMSRKQLAELLHRTVGPAI